MNVMKILLIALLGSLAGLVSCTKDKTVLADYRDAVVGDYAGISVNTYWGGNGFNYDTSSVMLMITKSDRDSIVDLRLMPKYFADYFVFAFEAATFKSPLVYHPPVLKISNDSLYFKHQPGLGPNWTECFATKIE